MTMRVDKITPTTININKEKKYSDFSTNFSVHPDTGDIFLFTDANAVKNSLKNLIMTNFYERRFNERLGCNIRSQLFEQLDGDTLTDIAGEVRNCIENNERRVSIITLNVNGNDTNPYAVTINLVFNINNIPGNQNLTFVVNRIR
jgi:phage baseplate assembly protein W